MDILLIAGHGGTDPGATAFDYKESELAREIVPMIANELKYYGVNITIYDVNSSAYRDIITLKKPYNFKQYDYVLEIHFNAYKKSLFDKKVKGSEIYVTTSEKIVTVEEAILKNMAALGFTNRGVKKKNMSVISAAKKQGVSGALMEICFIDDQDDISLYMSAKSNVAKAIAEGIATGYKLTKKEEKKADLTGHWAEETCLNMVNKGIMSFDSNGNFNPDKVLTRAEAAVIAERILNKK